MINKPCFNCEKEGEELHGYIICKSCKADLRLFTDETIKKHILHFQKSAYEEDIRNRLEYLEKDCIKKRIKLLHVQERIDIVS